jgi:hypothetical protein
MTVMFLWILALALAAVAAAVYAVLYAVRQRTRADVLARDLCARDDALEHFAAQTLPSLTEAIRRSEVPALAVQLPAGLDGTRFGQSLGHVAERHVDSMRHLQFETQDLTRSEAEAEAQWAIQNAEEAARAEVEASAREATSAAVRSFGASVVSLGADVSQVVSAALRTHRGDAVYETLIRIDHNVQQMIRQAQSYVIVSGGLPGRRWPQQSLTDVVGGATGRVRDYLRVRSSQSDRVVVSRAVEPLVHTLATLMDNGLRYSPPTSFVEVSFQEGHHGVTIIVDDAGVRMNAEQMEDARLVLANERAVDIHDLGPSPKVGFPGIAALIRRYGFTVYVDSPNVYGGMRAMIYIPETLLAAPQPDGDGIAASAVAEPSPEAGLNGHASEVDLFAVPETTDSGLPKRRRREAALVADEPAEPGSGPEPARPDIAAAWQSGSLTGRAAAAGGQQQHDEPVNRGVGQVAYGSVAPAEQAIYDAAAGQAVHDPVAGGQLQDELANRGLGQATYDPVAEAGQATYEIASEETEGITS